MRLLLISVTHGDVEIINRLASATEADAVVHSGDFGVLTLDADVRAVVAGVHDAAHRGRVLCCGNQDAHAGIIASR